MVKKEQTRTCIVNRTSGNKENLIRFVVDPDNNVVPDISCKLPGRGVWVTNNKQSVEAAIKRKLFAAGFKQKVNVSRELSLQVEHLLLEQVRQSLSIARKSGCVTTGFSKVEALARKGEVRVLFHASDGTSDGVSKIRSALIACQKLGGYAKGLPVIFTGFDSADLSASLGMGNLVHVALSAGGATRKVEMQIVRLSQYCSQ